ncbi:MAG: methylenetetrahydrofolate--tRNA-(uracil(54)-C(5))-methyltransferase (FADH(2)-oxidizing) TrmFO [Candidatus Latescibacteria bacterium]|nr:methylenetetrahydrofolate--tRNA-(uracil(54)-C(5))-methyltransferase (FADH(2)-oxidizing) TrmFO [Candidatus Latescibacterota bacterium]NIM21347.1 methylenetetrahydrofolate--tRNA-(uracil(54)-C(5))-methyltransferase (FADH(2)-oxidizing) TrmFO [Candidatus Latescibacterota bacterium]NIM65528.1 methylenetetrahydrofolate--tRNA-(uracil(54)-C(5))-methyltransferase (FADH(2)-oxidizing) TrmFO [Candidatus Latescibacterota bacterium]NIO01908.1 methylenetetrahydrofolate--tRNA-(uracil(54)-C(5))-methyltransfera
MNRVTIVGAGLAGSEAALQLACRGIPVDLVEMRPGRTTGAHRSGYAAEIVCSNSFKSTLMETAAGLLKAEMDVFGTYLLRIARDTSVPAGHALAVDRDLFAEAVTARLESDPKIEIIRRCQEDLDLRPPAVIATGPLTDATLSDALRRHLLEKHLYFYDAIAPSIDGDSVDCSKAFWASRYGKGDPDYLNIPLSRNEYLSLLEVIREAEYSERHSFEEEKYFEACLPIEVMVKRGEDTLRFGPLKPRGLKDPRTGKEPYAVVQLRNESKAGNLMGLVGFQTRMKQSQQKILIRSIPGLERASILRYGAIHRNMFLDVPSVCERYQRDRKNPDLYYAGQICGVEGYSECIMSGLVSALSIVASHKGISIHPFPDATMIGALMNYIHTPTRDFQPMNANMGILPTVGKPAGGRKARYLAIAERAIAAIKAYRDQNMWLFEKSD